jgi:hypothetical protein
LHNMPSGLGESVVSLSKESMKGNLKKEKEEEPLSRLLP